jgi:hypothetical protein
VYQVVRLVTGNALTTTAAQLKALSSSEVFVIRLIVKMRLSCVLAVSMGVYVLNADAHKEPRFRAPPLRQQASPQREQAPAVESSEVKAP